MRKTAHWLSVLLHPLFMPLFTLWVAMRVDPHLGWALPGLGQWRLLGLIALLTVVFPLMSTLLLVRAGLVRTLAMASRGERVAPFAITLLYHAMTWYLLHRSHLFEWPLALFSGAFLALAITTLITPRWKISAHTVGIGGLTGAIAGLSTAHALPLLPLLAGAILLIGALATARLIAGSHTHAQVYAGALLGFGCVYGCVLWAGW